MPSNDEQLTKIQALLAKAESTTFPEEAKALTAKAYELMEKWAIDDAILAHHRNAQSVDVTTSQVEVAYSPFKAPKQQLLCRLATLNGCRAVITDYRVRTPQGPKAYRHVGYVTLVGLPNDLRATEILYTSLLLQAEAEFLSPAVQERMASECSHPGHRTKWRNTFQDGFNAEVCRRIQQIKDSVRSEVEVTTPGVGLVLANKADLVNAKLGELYPKLGKKAGSNRGFAGVGAYGAGQSAGSRVDVGTPKAGSGQTAKALR